MRKFITLLAGLLLTGGLVIAQDDGASEQDSQEAPMDQTQFQGMETLRVLERGDHAYLVDGEGRAVYMFTEDEEDESRCTDENDCLANWPPVLVTDPLVAGAGLDNDLLGSYEREEGIVQVTYNGHLLYYYMGDRNEGDVTGQGMNDMWYLLDAEGEPLEDFEPGEGAIQDNGADDNDTSDTSDNADDNGNDNDTDTDNDGNNDNGNDTDDTDDSGSGSDN